MGSRKDILKNLGIPEYPWSSDDDEPAAEARPSIPLRSTAPQSTTPTSTSQGSARTQQSNMLLLSMLSNSNPPSHCLANPSSTTGSTTSRHLSQSSDPLSYMGRANHTPAPDMLVRVGDERGAEDIRRVLAFRRLTRNINMVPSCIGRYQRSSGYTIPRSHPRPGTVVPLEANSSLSPSRQPSTGHWRRIYRSGTNLSNNSNYLNVDDPGPSAIRRRRTQSMGLNNSDEEDNELVPALSRVPAAAPGEPPAGRDAEQDIQVSSNETSGTGVSLEEEIVEIPDEAAAADLITNNDPNLASTSQADDVVDTAQAEMQQTSQGVKRKRRSSSEDKSSEPFTVKEFNQSLLRLLECPVCLEWMEPPMSQCRRGHLVCSRCRARLASCPVCRTTFSSVRNRAMEGVAEMLRYPCRHGCGREVRLRRRTPHEASCAARKYACPAPPCHDLPPIARDQLHHHFHSKHMQMVKLGARHRFGIKVNSEGHDNWLIVALDQFFHMKVDVDIRTWGVSVYVAYIGPKRNAKDFAYEVTIDGQHNGRKMIYRRATHSDLESSSVNVRRQDCFHLSLDQALNFIRFKNQHCDAERFLEFDVEVSKIEPPPSRDDSDS